MKVHAVYLGEEHKDIEVFPFSDLHVGSAEFDKELFDTYVQHVLAEPNRFCFFNGDLIDNALKSSVSDIYKATMGPKEQILETVEILQPLVDDNRIWGIVGGNHENRTDREVGISPGEIIADKLRVPYFGMEVLIKIRFGKNKSGRSGYYTLYVTHGFGGGRKKGGKINNLESLRNIVIADLYAMGHTHTQIVTNATVNEVSSRYDMINSRDVYFINSGAFLDRGDGYAVQFGYEGLPKGCPYFRLNAKERKINVLMGGL